MSEYHYEKDADGIVTLTFDASGQSANTMNAKWQAAMKEAIVRLQGEEGLTGVVLASAKKTFFRSDRKLIGGDVRVVGVPYNEEGIDHEF